LQLSVGKLQLPAPSPNFLTHDAERAEEGRQGQEEGKRGRKKGRERRGNLARTFISICKSAPVVCVERSHKNIKL